MLTFSDAISLATLIVVVGTLFVYFFQTYELTKQTRMLAEQTKENNKLTAANVSLDVSVMMHRLSRLLLDNPKLRRYIYGDRPLPSREPLRSQVLLMAEMFLDLMTITIDQKPVFSESDFECWCRYFGDLLEKSPTLRYWYAETRDWYEPHVRELLDHLAAGRFPAAPRMAAGIPLQSRRFSRRRPDHGD